MRIAEDGKANNRKAEKSGKVDAGDVLAGLGCAWLFPPLWPFLIVWLLMNRDEKEGLIKFMSLYRQAVGDGNPFIQVKSYSNDALLGKYGMLGVKIVQ